ncbi:MAG: PEGA domain-containing protein, partial [Myxococcota bacterium]
MNTTPAQWFSLLMCLALCVSSIALAQDPPSPHGWLEIHTNYGALVTVDGQPYPRRSDYGMKLEANAKHDVLVKMGDKEKTYTVYLKPREKRILMVDITGYNTPPTPAPKTSATAKPARTEKPPKEEQDEAGKLTVYSKPKGDVFVDGQALGASTPMINRDLDVGRHEVQVKWEDGRMSEIKTIRIRKGSKLKL